MASRTLAERFIQEQVAEKLNDRHYQRKNAYTSIEEYTKLKRADVLLAFWRAPNRPYVVVVEAKSRTTIHQLKLKENTKRLHLTSQVMTAIILVGLLSVLGYNWYFNAMNTLLIIGLFIVLTALVRRIISWLEISATRSISAIDQLGRYPANEQWIAVGEDTFVRKNEYLTLKKQCRKNGIGLIVVTERGNLKLKLTPRPKHTFNNYLGRYGKKSRILKTIAKSKDYGPTPSERSKRVRQTLNASLLLSGVLLMGVMAYEDNNGPVLPDPLEEMVVDTAVLDLTTEQADVTEICDALQVNTKKFIVVDAILKREKAEKRVAELLALGMVGHRMVATECLNASPRPGRFVVFTGTVYSRRRAAATAARKHRKWCINHGDKSPSGKAMKVLPLP